MIKNEFINKMSPQMRSILFIIILIIIGFIIGQIIGYIGGSYLIENIEGRGEYYPFPSNFELTTEQISQIISAYTILTSILCALNWYESIL